MVLAVLLPDGATVTDDRLCTAQLYMSLARATSDLEKRNTVSHLEDVSFRGVKKSRQSSSRMFMAL
jgi:hypothetical protein